MGRVLLLLLLLGQDDLVWRKQPYASRPLEFQVSVPEGWNLRADRTGLVAEGKAIGFIITREPFLHDPKSFDKTWSTQLGNKDIATRVKPAKAGRYKAYQAEWEKSGRVISVFRLHVPKVGMLYNISFSVANGVDPQPVMDGVFRSFKCTAGKTKLELQKTAVGLGRVSMRLPVGYVAGKRAEPGAPVAWVKLLDGYTPPREAGSITIGSYPARPLQTMDGTIIRGGDVKAVARYEWDQARKKLGGRVTAKPRLRPARYGGLKGTSITAGALAQDGTLKRYFAYVGKMKQNTVVVAFLVDEREVLIHKDLFKKVCSSIRVKE